MHDCRRNGGHLFVLHPQTRTYTCHRCRRLFQTREPAIRTSTRLPPPSTSDLSSTTTTIASTSSSSGPWRCILETCNALACQSCADYIQSEFSTLQKRILDAEANHEKFDCEAAIKEIEKPPRHKPRHENQDGTNASSPGTSASTTRIPEPAVLPRAHIGPGARGLGLGDEDWGLDAKSTDVLEADDDDSSEGDDDDVPVIPFRTAAMAAAAARMKMRNVGPSLGRMTVRREEKAAM